MRLLLSSFLVLTISCSLMAQIRLGANIKVYQPSGEFNQHMGHTPAGISFSVLRQTSPRFSWGGEIGVAMYTAGEYDYELTANGRPGEYIEVYEDNCFWTAHAVARYSLYRSEAVEGYAEGRVGLTTFFTNQIAQEENPYFDSKTRIHGTAFNSGFGGGILLNGGKIFSKEAGKAWIDMGVNLNSGSTADYRNAPAISQEYSLKEGVFNSLTSYIGYRLGVVFDL